MARRRLRRLVTRRRVRRALLCLVLGEVMTVAVAWGFALFAGVSFHPEQAMGEPGFLYSTLIYGAFAWPVWCTPGFSRKRRRDRRRQRGLCEWCAYPVGDFNICPECGKPTGHKP